MLLLNVGLFPNNATLQPRRPYISVRYKFTVQVQIKYN
jgi:hypothetical protein